MYLVFLLLVQKRKTRWHTHTVTRRTVCTVRGHIVWSTSVVKNSERIRDKKTRDVTRTYHFFSLYFLSRQFKFALLKMSSEIVAEREIHTHHRENCWISVSGTTYNIVALYFYHPIKIVPSPRRRKVTMALLQLFSAINVPQVWRDTWLSTFWLWIKILERFHRTRRQKRSHRTGRVYNLAVLTSLSGFAVKTRNAIQPNFSSVRRSLIDRTDRTRVVL